MSSTIRVNLLGYINLFRRFYIKNTFSQLQSPYIFLAFKNWWRRFLLQFNDFEPRVLAKNLAVNEAASD